MNFKTHNETDVSINGTHLQGSVDVDYKTLKKIFGKPTNGDGYKVDAEWMIQFDDSLVASIYNYKDGINYNGRSGGTPKTKIRDWHIGGHDGVVVDRIKEIISKGTKHV